MKSIEFSKLYEEDYNLSDLFALKQYWRENHIFRMATPRKNNCLLYFCGCSAIYKFANTELNVPKGAILYIPEGAIYESKFFDCDDILPATILIEFKLSLAGEQPFKASDMPYILKQEGNAIINNLFNEAVDIYSSAVISLSKIKSVIYGLLSDLSYSERKKSIYSRGFNTIAKGILLLENDLKSSATVKDIANMCNVGESTFRRLFKEYTGKTPVEYRNERRIEYAKKLLNTGEMTIVEIAIETGYDDPAYFCRVFKKYVGITTSEYLKSNI